MGQWTRQSSVVVDDPVAGRIETRSEVQVRTLEELDRSLADAGFEIEQVYGDWDRRPADASARELIVVAIR